MSGVFRFAYRCPLKATEDIERAILLDGESFVTWAIGPLNEGEPSFLLCSTSYPQPDADGVVRVMIEWGRSISNACPSFLSPSEEDNNDKDIPEFIRRTLSNLSKITARIGPSGGVRGVGADTGATARGLPGTCQRQDNDDSIGNLIPTLGVERGKTYTFTLYVGSLEEGSS